MAGDSKDVARAHLADAGVYELPDDWDVVTLGDLFTEDRGIAVGVMYPGDHDPNGVPLIKAGDLNGSVINPQPEFRITKEKHQEYRRTALEGGELVMTLVGNVGQCAVVPPRMAGWNAARAVAVMRLADPTETHFVQQVLLSRPLQHLMDVWCNTTVQATLNLKEIRQLPLPWPPKKCRDAIAAFGKALDDKIELNRRMNATLEAMARALFQSWFVDFDPVRAKLDGRPPAALDPATAALFPGHLEESPIGKKPVGWEITTLETALSVLEVGGRPKGGVGGITSGIPSIGAESIVGVGQFDFGKTKYAPVEFYEGMKKGHIQSHDVLLYKDGGRPGEYEPHVSMFGDGFPFEKCSINEHVYRLRANERLSQEYLYFWLTSELALAEMRVKGTGVAIPGLNSTAVRSLTTLMPPKPIVEAFTKQAAPLVTRILANSKQSRTLATLRDTLLPKLLSVGISVTLHS